LLVVPQLVGRAGKCIQPVETRGRGVHQGDGNVGVYHKTEKSYRKFCKACGGHLLTEHPLWGVVDVYAATIPTYRHEPQLHVNYAEAVLRIKDGLPKMKDMPKEMGGSGETVPE
jgi:hypothetical protein